MLPDLHRHIYRMGHHEESLMGDISVDDCRRHIEPWLSSVFQSEHLSLLLGSGFSIGVAYASGGAGAGMSRCNWVDTELGAKIDAHAESSAEICGRGAANIEDQIRAALQLQGGLEVLGDERAAILKAEIDSQLRSFMQGILESERSILEADLESRRKGESLLVSFLLSFASRVVSRERLNLFTTNYDRLVEHGCDLAGLRALDRFVGALSPMFRAARLDVDMHYSPPGIRGEPRYLEGVIRLGKIHGSLDWRWETDGLRRCGIPFGATDDHPDIPDSISDSVMIYPNPAKDVETLDFPYAELLRDFASAICRPNSSMVTYGYGFGDDHINRILKDMLTIPSTHLVIIAWDDTKPDVEEDEANATRKRIIEFCEKVGKPAQISLLLGRHFGDLSTLVENYLPKPAIDTLTFRCAELQERRGDGRSRQAGDDADV